MFHSCRITANDIVSGTAIHSRVSMPLNLARASVEHRRREDSENHWCIPEDSVLDDSMVLLHSGLQWDVIILGPAAKRREPQYGLLNPLALSFSAVSCISKAWPL